MNSKFLLIILFFQTFQLGAFEFNRSSPIDERLTFSIDSLKIDDSNLQPKSFDDLRNKYNDDDFVYEYDTNKSGWWTRFKQWLNDLFKKWFNVKNSEDAANMTDWMLKIAAVFIFLLVAYFIFKAVMNEEGYWVFGKSSDKSVIPITDIESNLTISDFDQLTKAAENSGEYRLAIRFYYLWLLKRLSHAEIIEYDVEKTNSDYYNEIASENTKKQFSYTSYLYNYIWYGEFKVDNVTYEKAKTAFVKFLNSIKA